MRLSNPNDTAATGADGGDSSSSPARLLAAGEAWKRKLIDLAKRNRALNFRPTKLSTVAIVDEKPAEVFRQLVLQEQPMRFAPASIANESIDDVGQGAAAENSASSEADKGDWLDNVEYGTLGVDFVPYDRSALNDRYT